MRLLPSIGVAAVAVATTVVCTPVAFASAPGDNGTIKVHKSTTSEDLLRNEPKVCTFYLDAFYFDGLQQADWKIVVQPEHKQENVVASGSITLDHKGHGRTDDMTLHNGQYKVVWNFDGEHGEAKHKVFKVDCPSTPGGSTGATSNGGTTGSTTSGGTTGSTTTGGTTGSTTTGGTATGGTTGGTTAGTTTGGTTTGGSNGGSLAETGASVIGVSGVAAVLMAIGGMMAFRRRGKRQN